MPVTQCSHNHAEGRTRFDVIGIDNDLRKFFFGSDASTAFIKKIIKKNKKYIHHNLDIRNSNDIERIFKKYKKKNTNAKIQ